MDLRTLQKLQRDTGFNADFIEKAYNITRILHEMSESEELSKNLALRGGTALNFVYLDIPRLSIDVDLNFVGALEKGEMLRIRPHISASMRGLAEKLGCEAVMKSSSYIIDRFLFRYTTARGTQDKVKIEINYLERVSFVGNIKRSFKHFFTDIPRFRVNTYTAEEICAMKTKAMVERLYARDIFDVYGISQLKLRRNVARKLMILYMLMAGRMPDVEALVSRIVGYPDEEIVRGVGQFVRQGHAVDAATVKRVVVDFYREILGYHAFDVRDMEFLVRVEEGAAELGILFGRRIKYNRQAQKHPSLLHVLDIKKAR
ncbi:MAG: nucleotidyl transferase AbiEii/AbiGii toxin family protein [Candidatus Hadarchaeales archaeon]